MVDRRTMRMVHIVRYVDYRILRRFCIASIANDIVCTFTRIHIDPIIIIAPNRFNCSHGRSPSLNHRLPHRLPIVALPEQPLRHIAPTRGYARRHPNSRLTRITHRGPSIGPLWRTQGDAHRSRAIYRWGNIV